jgi:hypothetical protein
LKTVEPYDFSTWNMSPLAQLFGKSPKVKILCGNCKGYFTERFDMAEFRNRRKPQATCPHCKAINQMPFTMS